jgi:hypothetical protein
VLFEEAGGFDDAFPYYYEDLDLGWRLDQLGMQLVYEPRAVAAHLHAYDWTGIVRRMRGVATGERRMAAKHEWFEPFFRGRMRAAASHRPVSGLSTRLVDVLPESWGMPGRRGWPARARRSLEWRADTWYHQQLAEEFLDAWAADEGLAELRDYLGDRYDAALLASHHTVLEAEERSAASMIDFYRTSEAYLYDLTVFALSGTKVPYRRDVRRLVEPGARLLDYGCGIGSDGLVLLEAGYRVEFADYRNPSTRFLRWRLARRGRDAPVHDIEGDVPGGFDAAYCFDVLEHTDDPFGVLGALEDRAAIVVANFLEPARGETELHRPLPIPALLDHAQRRGLLRYRVYHDRSHLVAYRGRETPRRARRRGGAPVISGIERRLGPALLRRPGFAQVRRTTWR